MVNFSLKNSSGKVKSANAFLAVIAFVMLCMIMYFVVTTIFNGYKDTNNGEPVLVEYTKDATNPVTIPSKVVQQSTDQKYGMEFSYAGWLYVGDTESLSRFTMSKNGKACFQNRSDDCINDVDSLYHVFHKGDMSAIPNQCPGVWLKQKDNQLKLVVKLNTYKNASHTGTMDSDVESSYLEKYSIGNIPLKKWFHLTIVLINNKLDVYINGYLKNRFVLEGIPRQNIGHLYINQFGGFKGFVSRLQYFNYSLPIWKIDQLVKRGPSENFGPTIAKAVPPYLSFNWWTRKFGKPL